MSDVAQRTSSGGRNRGSLSEYRSAEGPCANLLSHTSGSGEGGWLPVTWSPSSVVEERVSVATLYGTSPKSQQLDHHHPADEAIVTLHMTDDVFLRPYSWARWPLGIPLSVD